MAGVERRGPRGPYQGPRGAGQQFGGGGGGPRGGGQPFGGPGGGARGAGQAYGVPGGGPRGAGQQHGGARKQEEEEEVVEGLGFSKGKTVRLLSYVPVAPKYKVSSVATQHVINIFWAI